MSFKNKVIAGVVGFQVIVMLLMSLIGSQFIDRIAAYTLQTKVVDVTKILEPVAIVGISNKDIQWFERTAKLILLSEDINAIKLTDLSGRLLVDEKSNSTSLYSVDKNLTKNNQEYGVLGVSLSSQATANATSAAHSLIVSIGVAIAILLLIVGGIIAAILIKINNKSYDQEINAQVVEEESPVAVQEASVVKEVVVAKKIVVQVEEKLPEVDDSYDIDEFEGDSPKISAENSDIEMEIGALAGQTQNPKENQTSPKEPDSAALELDLVDVVEYVVPGKENITNVESTAEDHPSFYLSIVDKTPDAIVLIDLTGKITAFNLSAERLFGFKKEDILGKNISETLLLNQDVERYEGFMTTLTERTGDSPNEIFESQFRNVENQIIEARTYLTSVSVDQQAQIVIFVRDIAQQKATESRLNYLAFNDELTDLPNLSLLSDHIRKATFDANKDKRQLVIIKLGLDRFKHVNESLGHRFGDYLIRNIASRLKDTIRRGDMVARLNGDQFVVALVDVDLKSNIDMLVQKYLDCFIEPFEIESKTVHMNASIGVTLYPNDEKSVDGLLRNAESAMFLAKEKGGNNYQFFSEKMREASQERMYLENELRMALSLDQFELHYQPQVNLKSGKVIGVEALIRWNHPELGLVPPLDFIPLAEETDLIIPIGEWVLREACIHNKKLMEERGESLILAVNLSARQFRNNDLIDTVAKVLNETEYPAEFLELEITESLLMENMNEVAGILEILSDQGIRISMDDFGTGYSSLSYLKRFPINTLKVDRSFVQDLENDNNNASIIAATIQMAHSLNIDIVAEGVETEGQLSFLASEKCDKIQGYYFSRPLESKALHEFLDENRVLEVEEDTTKLASGEK